MLHYILLYNIVFFYHHIMLFLTMICYYNVIICCDYYCIIYYYNLIIYDIYIYITIYLLLWKWRFLIRGATSISSCISSIMDSNSARIFAVFGSVWYFSEQFLLSHSTSPLAQTTYHQNWYKSIQDINAGLYHLSHFTRNIPHDTLFQGDCFPHAGNCEEGSGKQGLLVQEYMYLHIVLSLSLSLSLYIETRYSIQYMCIWQSALGTFHCLLVGDRCRKTLHFARNLPAWWPWTRGGGVGDSWRRASRRQWAMQSQQILRAMFWPASSVSCFPFPYSQSVTSNVCLKSTLQTAVLVEKQVMLVKRHDESPCSCFSTWFVETCADFGV